MGAEWIETPYGEFAADFLGDRLANLCDKEAGIQTGPFGSQLHQEDYVEFGTPIITVEHLGENRILHENIPKVSNADRDRLSRYRLQRGDIVFSRVGSVDRRALVRQAEEGWLYSGRCLRVRPDPMKINSEYLSYFFGLPAFMEHIRAIAVGATMPSLNTKLLSDIFVPYPADIDEQRAIGRVLSSLDDRIDHNRALAAKLEAIARRLFKSWFVDFDPVRAKAAGQKPAGLADDIAALFPDRFVDSELGEIPEGWQCRKVSDLCEAIFSGGTPHTQTPEYWGGDLPWLSSGETRSRFIVETEKLITQTGVNNSSTRLAKTGDVVIASAGQGSTRGQTSLLALDTYINQSVVALRAHTETYSSALLFLDLSSRYDEMRSISDSHSSRGSLTTKLLGSMLSVSPPKPVVTAFDALVTPIIERIVVAERENSRLGTIRDLLLPRLISGKLRVSEAEEAIAEAMV